MAGVAGFAKETYLVDQRGYGRLVVGEKAGRQKVQETAFYHVADGGALGLKSVPRSARRSRSRL